jgi:glycosyltransferase involved in cell wall biosynthesis
VLGVEGSKHDFVRHPQLKVSTLSTIRPRRFSQLVKTAWWRLRYVRNAEVFHPTYYSLAGGLEFADFKCPVVVTVHDFIHAAYPTVLEESALVSRHQREAILRADHLICVSKSTERELLERYPQKHGHTSVIYLASSFPLCLDPQPEMVFEKPTFLFVGRRGTYKNFIFLLRAFAKARQSHPRIRLCVAGESLSDEERWQSHFLGISDGVDSSVFPDEEALRELYRKSVALLYPSLHEGFGIPPLEAMASGTVAVTSNTTSLPEVVGDGGIMLDPADESAWTECILQIADDKIRRSQIIEKGRARAALFSWDKCARLHVATYRRFASAESRLTVTPNENYIGAPSDPAPLGELAGTDKLLK